MQRKSPTRLAFVALLGGAIGIGFAPIFVRLSEVGPSATAFYRVLFALPFLWLASTLEARPATVSPHRPGAHVSRFGPAPLWLCAAAGLLFAGDLAFWHWSIRMTSVANSTLLTNFAPFFVILGARVLFAERITPLLIVGMAVACAGAAMLVGASLRLTPRHMAGDALALVTAGFYGGYLLTIKHLRHSFSTVRILFWSGLVSCVLLLGVALLSREVVRISSIQGWLVLLGLGLISHLCGQGLIAYALAHLPAGFSSVGLLLQPVVAALLAWVLLAEPLTSLQALGGMVILVGIAVASRGQAVRSARPTLSTALPTSAQP
jgi:drug/metabolite transporter (DMT)-like permease